MTNEKMQEEFYWWFSETYKCSKSDVSTFLAKYESGLIGREQLIFINKKITKQFGNSVINSWLAWQASRENIEIDLPIKFDLAMAGDKSTRKSFFLANQTIDAIKQKLTGQGFKVK